MASTDDRERFPLWFRLGVAFAVIALWIFAYGVQQLANKPGPPAVLNGAFILVIGSIFTHELGRTVGKAVRRVLDTEKSD